MLYNIILCNPLSGKNWNSEVIPNQKDLSHLVEKALNGRLEHSPPLAIELLKSWPVEQAAGGKLVFYNTFLTTGILRCTRYYLCTRNSIQCNITTLHSLEVLQVSICIVLNSSTDKNKRDLHRVVISCAYFSVDTVVGGLTRFHHITFLVPPSVCCFI